MKIKWLLIYFMLVFGIIVVFSNPPSAYAGHACPTANTYCDGTQTCHDTCDPYGHSCGTECGSCGASACSSGGGSSGGGGPYNCGPAASCESLGKTGSQGDIICQNPCGSAGNTCWTSGACTDSTACTVDSQCPTNITCAVPGCGVNRCNSPGPTTGWCSTDCTGCSTSTGCSYSACGGNGCSSSQVYVSGGNCPSWYNGAGCYPDNSCGTSSTPVPTPTPCPTMGSTSTLSPSGTISAGTRTLTWTNVTNATAYNVRVNDQTDSWDSSGCSNGTGYGTTNSTDLCMGPVTSGSVSYNFQAGRSYTYWIDAYNACGNVSYLDATVTVSIPDCNSGISCGVCTVPDNTCGSNNGTQTCEYTTHTSETTCTRMAALSQICSRNNCFSGYSCNVTSCVRYLPWIQVTGDVHSNTRINIPGGP